MSATLRSSAPLRNAATVGETASPIEACAAMGRALWRHGAEVAKAMRRRVKTVQDWQNPTPQLAEERPVHPVYDLQLVIEACLLLGVDRDDALAPLRYLNRCFDEITVPRAAVLVAAGRTPAEILRDVPVAIQYFGAWAGEVAQVLADGEVKPSERRKLEELREAVGHLVSQVLAIQSNLDDALKAARRRT